MDDVEERMDGLKITDLRRILDVTRELARPLDLGSVLTHVIDAGRAVLHADRGTVFLHDAAAHELVARVATGIGDVRIPDDRGIAGECVRTRQIINVPDCYADPRHDPAVDDRTGYHTRCLLSVPLIGNDDALVGVLQLLNKENGVFDASDVEIAAALAAQCAVVLHRARMTEQLIVKERFERELAVAREIQDGFLPHIMPILRGYAVIGVSRPATETGGDTFDLVRLDDNRMLLLICDATGHGVGPALSATQVRAMVRMAARLEADLDRALVMINDQLVEDLALDRSVTAFLGILDTASHRVTYHSAGQAPLLHFHAADDRAEWLEATTFPLGLMPQPRPVTPATIDLAPGDILGLITDGVFECRNESNDLYGTEPIDALLRTHHSRALPELIDALLQDLGKFGQSCPQGDDITILLARRDPA